MEREEVSVKEVHRVDRCKFTIPYGEAAQRTTISYEDLPAEGAASQGGDTELEKEVE